MSMLHRLNRRIRAIFLHRRVERELDEELTFHLQMEAEYNERRGLDPSEARAAAVRDFGAILRVKEEAREVRGIQILENIAADVRYAARWLRASPAFTTVTAVTIALGIGGTTAMFSLADEVLLSRLPVRAPEQLYFINSVGPEPGRGGMITYPLLQRLQVNESFGAVSATAEDHLPVFIDDEPEQALTQIASGNFFQMLGVEPALGRLLTPQDEQFPASVAVLSHDYWQRRFGGSAAVLGRVVRVGEQRLTIVGVTRNGYTGIQTGRRIDITVPITYVGERMIRSHGASFFSVLGRLQPDAAVQRAELELEGIHRGYWTELGRSNDESVRPYHMQLEAASRGGDRLRAQFARPIWILLALMIAVLTIACANIANLLLARGAARQQELSIRAAIGAGRPRIIQQFLTETLLLFSLGSILGLLVATFLGRTLSSFFAIGRLPVVLDIDLDARALAFAATACLVTGILAGLAPALRAARRDPAAELRQRGTPRSTLPVSRSLVVVQVALSIAILVAGSLLVATLARLRAIDPGFRTRGILTMSLHPLRDPASPAEADVLWSSIQQQVSAVRGVEAAGLAVLTPLSGRDAARRVRVPGFVPRSLEEERARVNHVSNGFFETFGMSLVMGRTFTARDTRHAPNVAVINEAAARHYFSGRNPLGVPLGLGPDSLAPYEVIGVVRDAKHSSLRDEVPPMIYVPVAQRLNEYGRFTLVVRTAGDPLSLLTPARKEVLSVKRDILISDVMTIERQIDYALMRERLLSGIAAVFGALGLLLAAIGLYGLASYTVISRQNEIAIRLALGAQPGAIRRLFLREAGALAGAGVLLGLPLSLAATRAVRSLLFGVEPTNPLIIAVCAAILLAVVGVASYLPARRASTIDPAVTFARG